MGNIILFCCTRHSKHFANIYIFTFRPEIINYKLLKFGFHEKRKKRKINMNCTIINWNESFWKLTLKIEIGDGYPNESLLSLSLSWNLSMFLKHWFEMKFLGLG